MKDRRSEGRETKDERRVMREVEVEMLTWLEDARLV